MSDLGSSTHGEAPDAADQDLEDFVQNPKKKNMNGSLTVGVRASDGTVPQIQIPPKRTHLP